MPALLESASTTAQSPNNKTLLDDFIAIVGKGHVLTNQSETQHYRSGFRFGSGKALAVVFPGSLVQQWKVLKACIDAKVIVIPQASNTGLTGGSTPFGDDYDRDIVIINTSRIKHIYPIDGGKQVICLPGATLDQLEKTLQPIGREPHSVIGSSCIGASVFGGICNNSGGALVQRGPAYTEMALYARVDEAGQLELINHLGVRLDGGAEAILARLDAGSLPEEDILHGVGAGHDREYINHVRLIDEPTPARFNADPRGLYEASGSAGKVMLFAVRLDTFPIEQNPQVFYIGTNDTQVLTNLRREILSKFEHMPIAAEYMHRDIFEIGEKYGKDTFLMIQRLGTAKLPFLFGLKARLDSFFDLIPFLPAHLTDRMMQAASHLFPSHLPPRMKAYNQQFEHHLLLKVSAEGTPEARKFLQNYFEDVEGDFFECTAEEGKKAFLHRFAAAGAANRYRAVHSRTVENIMALDIALPRNATEWFETLPAEVEEPILLKLYYGHFLCHVFHQDYIVKKGHDCMALEHMMWDVLDSRQAEYPAEHNVGHLYYAKPALKDHYQALDPTNTFNPGIGHTSKYSHYQ